MFAFSPCQLESCCDWFTGAELPEGHWKGLEIKEKAGSREKYLLGLLIRVWGGGFPAF